MDISLLGKTALCGRRKGHPDRRVAAMASFFERPPSLFTQERPDGILGLWIVDGEKCEEHYMC